MNRSFLFLVVATLWTAVPLTAEAGSPVSELQVTFRTPDNVRAFVEPEPPTVVLAVNGQTSTAAVNVKVTFVDTAQVVAEHAWQVDPDSPAEFDITAKLPDRFGVYQADATIDHSGTTAHARIRWARLPELPAEQRWDRLGLNIHILDDNQARLVTALGIKWCRVDWMWTQVAPASLDDIHWNYLDPQAAAAKAFGIEMLPVLNTNAVPDYAKLSDRPHPYFQIDRFNEFAEKILDRYGDVLSAVQLYNEPDWGIAQNLGPDEQSRATALNTEWRQFVAEYIHSAAGAIRARHPRILIVGPGFPANPTNAGGWTELLDPPYNIGAALDAYSWHNYPAPRNAPPDSGSGSVIGIDQFIRQTRPKVRGHQVWITEQGYSSLPERNSDRERLSHIGPFGLNEVDQGNYLVRLFLLEWEGGIDRAFLFHLNGDPRTDDHPDPYAYYGLTSDKWNGPKLSFAQLAAMGHFLMKAEFVGRVQFKAADSAHALRFREPGREILVIWTSSGNQTITAPGAWKNARVFDAFGNALPMSPTAQLGISGRPLYLVRDIAE